MKALLVSCLVLLTAACTPLGGGLRPAANSPPPADGGGKGVDGLLVGHRLMEANEPELALKAYYRAAAEDGIDAEFEGVVSGLVEGDKKRAFALLQAKVTKLGVAGLSGEEKQQYLQALSARGRSG